MNGDHIHNGSARAGLRMATLTFCFLLAQYATALAQHDDHTDMLIGADGDGSGALVLDYPFDEIPSVRVTDTGFAGLFSSVDPGFIPSLDDPLEGIFELDLNTAVGMRITDKDPNVSILVGATPLTTVGSSAVIGTHDSPDPEASGLHEHATFQVVLDTPDNTTFAEGRFSFRLYDAGGVYADSNIATLTLSNGLLSSGESDPKCLKAVAAEQSKLMSGRYKRMSQCMDSVIAAEASGKTKAALKKCSIDTSDDKSLPGRFNAARALAVAKLGKSCGPLSNASTPFTESQVYTHLGMGACRMEEMIGATYVNALEELAGLFDTALGAGTCDTAVTGLCVGGPNGGASCAEDEECSWEEAVAETFTCLKNSAGEGGDEG